MEIRGPAVGGENDRGGFLPDAGPDSAGTAPCDERALFGNERRSDRLAGPAAFGGAGRLARPILLPGRRGGVMGGRRLTPDVAEPRRACRSTSLLNLSLASARKQDG